MHAATAQNVSETATSELCDVVPQQRLSQPTNNGLQGKPREIILFPGFSVLLYSAPHKRQPRHAVQRVACSLHPVQGGPREEWPWKKMADQGAYSRLDKE